MMKTSTMTKLAFSTALAAFSFGAVNLAHADDPLKYPPFSWPSDKPAAEPAQPEKKTAGKPGKTDIYQTRDEKKQWYDGDFMGLDDD